MRIIAAIFFNSEFFYKSNLQNHVKKFLFHETFKKQGWDYLHETVDLETKSEQF